MAIRAIPAASIASKRCSTPNVIASPTGASRPTKSTTAASSTSTIWPPSASKIRACSKRFIGSLRSFSKRDGSPACASIIPTGCSTPKATSKVCRRSIANRRSADSPEDHIYVVAEKILSFDEPLPANWAIAGTTGYDFMNVVNRLLVDPAGLATLRASYEQLTDQSDPAAVVVYESKREVLHACAGQRGQRARRPARSHRSPAPRQPRLHAASPRTSAARSHRLPAGVPHVCSAARVGNRRGRLPPHRHGRAVGQAPQSRRLALRVRLHRRRATAGEPADADARASRTSGASSHSSCSKSPARPWPRVWRTRRSIATTRWRR